jgi:hypothetical protein
MGKDRRASADVPGIREDQVMATNTSVAGPEHMETFLKPIEKRIRG